MIRNDCQKHNGEILEERLINMSSELSGWNLGYAAFESIPEFVFSIHL
jgi:hypothetical protein